MQGGGCSGLSYNIRFDTQPRERDRIFQFDDVRVFVDPKSFIYLHGMILDYEETLMHQGFVFQNPNATKSCGCGTRSRNHRFSFIRILRCGGSRESLPFDGAALQQAAAPYLESAFSDELRYRTREWRVHNNPRILVLGQDKPTTAKCWSCGAMRAAHFCQECGKVQPPAPVDYFSFFGLPYKLALDTRQLERDFYALSRHLHPDINAVHGDSEQEWSLEKSSQLNDAYRTLKDPY